MMPNLAASLRSGAGREWVGIRPTVGVAMSGGVDSSVAAALLVEQGYEVIGLTMHLWTDESGRELSLNRASGCCSIDMARDAAKVAERMGFRHYVLDLSREFHSVVIKNFGNEYFAGRTPNPCVRCNSYIKWQSLLERAQRMGCEYLATGHYARVESRHGRMALLRAKHFEKDQSYALWGLSQSALKRTLFPLGELSKSEVRALAAQWGLVSADKPESQDICFVPDNDYRRFLNENFESGLQVIQPGEIVGPDGSILGRHDGIYHFTVGQRKGLGISSDRPLYVTRIDPDTRRVYVNDDDQCSCCEATVHDVNWISIAPPRLALEADIKVRYRDTLHRARIVPVEEGRARLEFLEPVRAVTPGQSAVFYDGDYVLGGGILE